MIFTLLVPFYPIFTHKEEIISVRTLNPRFCKPTLYLWQAPRENEAEIGATYVNGVIMIVCIFSKLIFEAILKSYPGTRFRENKT